MTSLVGDSDSQEVVRMYLRKRNYCASGGSSAADCGQPLTQPVQELAGEAAAETVASGAGAVRYTAASLDTAAADSQYSRFSAWLAETPEPYRSQLQSLLFPVFAGLHLELTAGGHNPARFYSRHHAPFMFRHELIAVCADLAAVNSPDDLQRAPRHVKQLRASRTTVRLSEPAAEYLRRALRSPHLALVLHVVNQQVELWPVGEDGDSGETETETAARRPSRRRTPGSSQRAGKPPPLAAPASDSGSALQAAISALHAAPPSPPTICAYRVWRPLSCAALSPSQRVLAAGGDWGAAVWSLAQEGLPATDNPAARVPLGCDRLDPAEGEGPGCGRGPPGSASVPLRGHTGSVYSVAFGGESGEVLLTAGEDATLRAWRTDSWPNVCVYRGHSCPVWCVRCQPTSPFFISGSMDRTARLWTYERVHQLRVFAGHTQDVDAVALHPNGNYLCTASVDGSTRLWTLTDAAQVRVMTGHVGVVHQLQFSPDGRLLAAAGEDARVRVYDLGTGGLLHELTAPSAAVSALLWTPGGRALAAADRDGTINIWHLPLKAGSGDTAPDSSFPCPQTAAASLQYSPHNYLVAVYGDLQ